MPLLKSVPEPPSAPVETPAVQPPDTVSRLEIGGVPMDIYRYFGTELNIPEREVGKLKAIYDWARDGANDLGDVLSKISRIERRLGQPTAFEKRYDKVYNWCKMSLYIKDMEKRRAALENIKEIKKRRAALERG